MNIEIYKKEENCYTLKELLELYSSYIKNPMVVINHNYELLYYTQTNDVDNVYKEIIQDRNHELLHVHYTRVKH